MTTKPFSLDGLSCAPGMSVSGQDGTYELRLDDPVGTGTMRARMLSPFAFCATVDFACEHCPSIAIERLDEASWFQRGTWFTCNLCLEGRCEVSLPPDHFAVVTSGDFCVSSTREFPHEYHYPSGRYRGIELFLNTMLPEGPAFSLLERNPRSLEDIARSAGVAAVIFEDDELNQPMARLGNALAINDDQLASIELLCILTTLQRRDLAHARPHIMLTRTQMAIVQWVHDTIEEALDMSHDARALARKAGVSAATLNNHFSNLYGETIASYLRRRRMERGHELLRAGASVAEASMSVGYANPSKFAAAFKRVFGETTREARMLAHSSSWCGDKRRNSSAPGTPPRAEPSHSRLCSS